MIPKDFFKVLCITFFGCLALSPVQADLKPSSREDILLIQIFLDEAHFGPGYLDGYAGAFTSKAVYAYNRSQGRKPDAWEALLKEAKASIKQAWTEIRVEQSFLNDVNEKLPRKYEELAKEKRLLYRSLGELVSERYHTDLDYLRELNGANKIKTLKVGDQVKVPNVTPFLIEKVSDRKSYPSDPELSQRYVIVDTKARQLFIYAVGQGAEAPKAKNSEKEELQSDPVKLQIDPEIASAVIVEDDVLADKKLIALFPITPGQEKFIHYGEWKLKNAFEMPTWRYDKELLKKGVRSKEALNIPGGPNNPIGVVWMGLSKSGIGIHGTSSPETIGRSRSAGCIRTANWDAIRLSNLIRPGATVVIR